MGAIAGVAGAEKKHVSADDGAVRTPAGLKEIPVNLLFGFAPFLAFAILSHLSGIWIGLLAGTIVSAVLVCRELVRRRSPKILELGTMILFGALCLYTLLAAPQWSLMGVRLVVDAGLLLIVLGSLLLGKPFTIQYAREQVPPEYWNTAPFLETNRRITEVWAIAFAVMVIADILLLFAPQLSPHVGIVMTILALGWAAMRTSKLSNQKAG